MRSSIKRLISTFAILAVVAGIALMSVGQTSAQGKTLNLILVSHGGPGNPFWVTVIKGMNDAGKTFGVNVQWLSANSDDVPSMPKYLDQASAANPDGLGITSPNPDIIRDGLTQISKKGVPIIIFNTDVMKQAGVTADKITTTNVVDTNTAILTDYFKSHPKTNAITTLGPIPADAYFLYLKDAGIKPGTIFHTTHDTSPTIFDNIKS